MYSYAYRLDNGKVVRPRGRKLVRGEDTFFVPGLKDGPHTIAVRSHPPPHPAMGRHRGFGDPTGRGISPRGGACASPVLIRTPLPRARPVQVRATDVMGSEDPTPVVYAWTVDTVPPTVQILQGPSHVTRATEAHFVVGCAEPYAFTYRLDGGKWRRGRDGAVVPEGSEGRLAAEEEPAALVGGPALPPVCALVSLSHRSAQAVGWRHVDRGPRSSADCTRGGGPHHTSR